MVILGHNLLEAVAAVPDTPDTAGVEVVAVALPWKAEEVAGRILLQNVVVVLKSPQKVARATRFD